MIDSPDRVSSLIEIKSAEFWTSWQPRMDRTASRFSRRRWIDRDDLLQSGRLALVKAAAGYDADHGSPFDHYGLRAVRNAVYDEAMLGRPRIFTNPTRSAVSTESPSDSVEIMELSAAVGLWRESLPARLAVVFDLLYVRGLSQREAAKELGRGQPRVAQLHKELLVSAREAFVPFDPTVN
jgi:RNA polymerase sigma factor (sigma-70 family)